MFETSAPIHMIVYARERNGANDADGTARARYGPPASGSHLGRCGWQDAPVPLVNTPNTQLSGVGKAARKRLGRSALGPWDPAARQADALEIITTQSAARLAPLIPIRHARMAVSPWTYYRGA